MKTCFFYSVRSHCKVSVTPAPPSRVRGDDMQLLSTSAASQPVCVVIISNWLSLSSSQISFLEFDVFQEPLIVWQGPGDSHVLMVEAWRVRCFIKLLSKAVHCFQSSSWLLFTWQYSVSEEFVYKQMFVKVSVENISTVRTHHTSGHSLQSVVNWPVLRPSFNPINYIIYDLITLFFFLT